MKTIILLILLIFVAFALFFGCTQPSNTITSTTTTTIASYTITFDKNDMDATGDMLNQTIVSGLSANLIACTYTKANWTFTGWSTSPSDDVVYIDQASYTMGSADVILYAKWEYGALATLQKKEMVSIIGGQYTQTDGTNSFSHTISNFSIGKYEVTYELWYTVHQWAISNGYSFANAGKEGSSGLSGAPTAAKYEPVTTVNWRDAIVWCNAYSEMNSLTPCYTYSGAIIKNSRNDHSSDCDNAVCNWIASGYRLPSEGEWQYVASYIDGSSWLSWNHASGDITSYCSPSDGGTSTVFGNYAWYHDNCSSTKDVGTNTPNQLAVFDMSGNAWEWCWDWKTNYPTEPKTNYRGEPSGSQRVRRGGGWSIVAVALRVGYRNSFVPSQAFNFSGFRVARSY